MKEKKKGRKEERTMKDDEDPFPPSLIPPFPP
jgi:hypothetical protein